MWIEGDNIYDSNDSRKFGSVPYGLVYGRVFWRVSSYLILGSLTFQGIQILLQYCIHFFVARMFELQIHLVIVHGYTFVLAVCYPKRIAFVFLIND